MTDARQAPDGKGPGKAQGKSQAGGKAAPAAIRLIYESRDGKFCLFEDAHGHLSAVRASNLA